MDTPLPSNETLNEFSEAIPWQEIEDSKQRFNEGISQLAEGSTGEEISLDALSEAVGLPITAYYDESDKGNILLARQNGRDYILGAWVSRRYRSGRMLAQSVVPYNLNPSVNHTNIDQTDYPSTRLQALGSELELGLIYRDGRSPDEEDVQNYINIYQHHARKLGITPHVDHEACQYQIEVHVAPATGYYRTRSSLDGIMSALVATSETTGLQTAIMSCYPTESDFRVSNDPKVQSAVDLMIEVNNQFPEYQQRLAAAHQKYHLNPQSNVVETFRLQGCHIHLDLAGRSEALGLLSFHTMLRSATAIANAAVLKGGPFVNGTCDAELLCAREHLRCTTVTGRAIEMPLSPHLVPGHMERFGALLRSERVNATGRALLYEDGLGEMVSVMHNPIGRIRPDLGWGKRICTLESTGMPVNVSASRMAAVLTDFAFTQAVVENYFRRYGCDLTPMYDDQTLWAILGPYDTDTFWQMQDVSDREGTDLVLLTAAGTRMALHEFYEMKRRYMHKHLVDMAQVTPRQIDDIYMSLQRMLDPPSGSRAETIEQYISDPKLRSTGNWGRILRNGFVEAGGTPGDHNPEAVLQVVNRVHDALRARYL